VFLSQGVEIIQSNSLFSNLFFFYSVIIVFLFFYGIIDNFYIKHSSDVEFSFLVFFILLGGLSLFYVHTLVDLILALEVVTLSSYVLVAFERKNRFSAFAGVQYFILGSIPSAMLILGGSLLYKN
jgi:NADH-quinone oxidoreductase subunit N